MPKKSPLKWLYAIAIVAILSFTVYFMAFYESISTEEAAFRAGEYFQELTNGTNPGALYNNWNSTYFQESTSEFQYAAFLSENPIVYDVDYIEFTYQAIEKTDIGKKAILGGTIHANDDSTALLEAHLVKENDQYKMLFFAFNYPETTEEINEE
jgi:hypothetical protein